MKNLFRTVGHLEALSFLVLLGIAMPMKYYFGFHEATRIPGMAHGLLFLAYIGLAHKVADDESWSGKQLFLAYVASVLPLGAWVYDYKFLRPKKLS